MNEQIISADHYEGCPQYRDPDAPNCYCDGIAQANDNYWTDQNIEE